MTKITLKDLIAMEIDRINQKIDRKIRNGKSYLHDAQKHRALLAEYRRIDLRKKRYLLRESAHAM